MQCLIAGLFICSSLIAKANPPDALVHALTSRKNFKTMEANIHELVWLPGGRPETKNYKARIDAHGDLFIDFYGNDEGQSLPSNQADPGFGCASVYSGIQFVTERGKERAFLRFGSSDHLVMMSIENVRSLFGNPLIVGLTPAIIPSMNSVDNFINHFTNSGYDFTEEANGGKIVVRASYPSKAPRFQYVWTIDPGMDFAICSMEKLEMKNGRPGRREIHGESQYRLAHGKWWPHHTLIRDENGPGVRELTWQTVEFDKPSHKRDFRGAEALAPIGVMVMGVPEISKADPKLPNARYVGAGEFIPDREFQKEKKKYDLAPFEEWKKNVADARKYYPDWAVDDAKRLGLPDVEWNPELWEAYVRRWIFIHSAKLIPSTKPGDKNSAIDPLDASQKEAAWAIYGDCKKRVGPEFENRLSEEHFLSEKLNQTINQKGKQEDIARLKKKIEEHQIEENPRVQSVFQELTKRLDGILRSGQTTDLADKSDKVRSAKNP